MGSKIAMWAATCLLIIIAGLPGCQSLLNYKSGIVSDPNQIVALSGTESESTWQNRDVKITYRSAVNNGKLEISGKLEFANRFIEYSSLDEFNLILTLVDPQRNVLDMIGIASTAYAAFEPLSFKKAITLPPNASGMAFFYTGGVSSPDSDERIWNYPIKR
jgi:hypothetical protein